MLLKIVCVRRCALLASSLLLLGAASVAIAEDSRVAKSAEAPAEVELFAAIESGEVDVVLIPRDSKQVTIQVANKTDRPLSVRMPEAFGAVPVLAQVLPGGGGGVFGGIGAGDNLAQGLGIAGGGGGNPLLGGGLMNIPPGKIVKVKRPAVCLEHGKPEPGPRMPYRIAQLEEVSADAGVRELLSQFPLDRSNQRVAQLAAWHLANGKTWQQLDGLTTRHINRQVTRQFSRAEIRAARQLVASLPSQREGGPSPSRAASLSINQR